MNLRDRNLRMVLLKAFAEAIEEELARERATHRDDLVKRYDDEGTKSFDVFLPGGHKVASVTLSVPKPSVGVTDAEALVEWAEQNAPEILDAIEHPATPAETVVIAAQAAWTEHVANPKRVSELLARVKPVDAKAGGAVVDPDTGQVVEGVTYSPAPQPKSFSVRFTDDGRQDLGRAYRAGELSDLLAGTPLPVIEPTAVTT